jgi:MFS superfamily sulfate permease-like transporter
VLIPDLLSRIPLATLAAVLLLVGWKLTTPALFKQQWKQGKAQFIPFVTTVVAILFTDLLIGIGIGLAVGLFFVLKANAKSSVIRTKLDDQVLIRFSKDVSFLQKNKVRDYLRALPDNSSVLIDGSRSIYIDHDIVEVIEDFMTSCESRNISVTLQKSSLALCKLFKE